MSLPTYGIADISGESLAVEFRLTNGLDIDVSFNNTDDAARFAITDDLSKNLINIDVNANYASLLDGSGVAPKLTISRPELNNSANARVSGSAILGHKVYALKSWPSASDPSVNFVEPTETEGTEKSTAEIIYAALQDQNAEAALTSASNEIIYSGSVSSQNDDDFEDKVQNVRLDISSGPVTMKFEESYVAGTQYKLQALVGVKLPAMQDAALSAYVALLEGSSDPRITLHQGVYYILNMASNNTEKDTVFKGTPAINLLTVAPRLPTSLTLDALRLEGDMNANVLDRIVALAKDVSGGILERDVSIVNAGASATVDIKYPEANFMSGDGTGVSPNVAGTFSYVIDISNIPQRVQLSDQPFLFSMIDTSNYKDAVDIVSSIDDGLRLASKFRIAADKWVTASNDLITAVSDKESTGGVPNYYTSQWYIDLSNEVTAIDISIAKFDASIVDVSNEINGVDGFIEGSKSFAEVSDASKSVLEAASTLANNVRNDAYNYNDYWDTWQKIVNANAINEAKTASQANNPSNEGIAYKIFAEMTGIKEDYTAGRDNTAEQNAYTRYVKSMVTDASLVFYERILPNVIGEGDDKKTVYYTGNETWKNLLGKPIGGSVTTDASAFVGVFRKAGDGTMADVSAATWTANLLATKSAANQAAYDAASAQVTIAEDAAKKLTLNKDLIAEYQAEIGSAGPPATGLTADKIDASNRWDNRIAKVDTYVETASTEFIKASAELLAVRKRYFDYSGDELVVATRGPEGASETVTPYLYNINLKNLDQL